MSSSPAPVQSQNISTANKQSDSAPLQPGALPYPGQTMATARKWPWWKTTLWIYSIIYTSFWCLIFFLVAFEHSNSTQNSNSTNQVFGTIAGVMFIPVLVFLVVAHSKKH